MKIVAIPVDFESEDQEITLRLCPDDRSVIIRMRLEWREYVSKWFCTLWDATTGECLVSNLPIIGSQRYINDLLGQFGYKRIGTFSCVPLTNEMQGKNPDFETMRLFELLWGDHLDI